MKLFSLVFALLALFNTIDSLKVLGVLPMGSNSHFAIGNSIIKALVEAGHEATVIAPYPQKKPMKNYRHINTKPLLDQHEKDQKGLKRYNLNR